MSSLPEFGLFPVDPFLLANHFFIVWMVLSDSRIPVWSQAFSICLLFFVFLNPYVLEAHGKLLNDFLLFHFPVFSPFTTIHYRTRCLSHFFFLPLAGSPPFFFPPGVPVTPLCSFWADSPRLFPLPPFSAVPPFFSFFLPRRLFSTNCIFFPRGFPLRSLSFPSIWATFFFPSLDADGPPPSLPWVDFSFLIPVPHENESFILSTSYSNCPPNFFLLANFSTTPFLVFFPPPPLIHSDLLVLPFCL